MKSDASTGGLPNWILPPSWIPIVFPPGWLVLLADCERQVDHQRRSVAERDGADTRRRFSLAAVLRPGFGFVVLDALDDARPRHDRVDGALRFALVSRRHRDLDVDCHDRLAG